MKKNKKCSCGCETDNIIGGVESVQFISMTPEEKERLKQAIKEGKDYKPIMSFSKYSYKFPL